MKLKCLSIPPSGLLSIGVNVDNSGVIYYGKVFLPYDLTDRQLDATEAIYESFPASYEATVKDRETGEEWVEQCNRVACPNGIWTNVDMEVCRLFIDNNILHLFEFGTEDETKADQNARFCMNLYVLYDEELQIANKIPATLSPMLLVRYDATDVGIVYQTIDEHKEKKYFHLADEKWEEVTPRDPFAEPKDSTVNLLDASVSILPTLEAYNNTITDLPYLERLYSRMLHLNQELLAGTWNKHD